jgi:DNA-binding HxlR family transcriptional regulator
MELSMGRTLCLIGDKWTLMIVYSLLRGPKRFGELLDSLGNISPKTLSQRLKMLEDVEFVDRHAYVEIPPRVEYSLTEKGEALLGILEAIQEFGEKYLSDVDDSSHTSEECE